MVFVKATEDSEKGVRPTAGAFAAMDWFNIAGLPSCGLHRSQYTDD